jgi:hypothetical protein
LQDRAERVHSRLVQLSDRNFDWLSACKIQRRNHPC